MSFPEDDTEIRCSLSPVTEMPPEFPEDEDGTSLVPCSICNRTFNPNALERHQRVCEKLQTKTRRKFDSTKQRQDGLDLHHSELTFNNEKEEKKKKSRWREKHKEFLRTIRAAKGSQDDEDDDGSPQKHIPSDYIQCPHCERYFGPKAADRHINWCGEQKSRLPRSHTNEDTEAVQRLKTRTKYAPPKPGQSGWKAPKKRDVISSIPPPNVGANITPPGRLITPPSPSHSHASPPYQQRQQYSQRHFSPPPLSPTRKSSLPPGPPRYGTNSLGRAAGKQFSAMLQSVTGSSPGYGNSSGYGTQSLYGSSPNQNHHQTFKRSASLRLPKRRSGGAGRMARHRDLASDMLASVTLGGKAKREEPEGDEASNMTPFYDRSPSNKTEKERLNEKKKEDSNEDFCDSKDLEKGDEYSDSFDSSEDEDLNLDKIKSKREALDKEIRELEKQLQTTDIGKNKYNRESEVHSTCQQSEGFDFNDTLTFSSHHESINDLDITNCDSDDDLDVKNEEFYLKSSTSASGDDDVVDAGLIRPRSVHFHDEILIRENITSDSSSSQSLTSTSKLCKPWSAGSERSWCQSEAKGNSHSYAEALISNSKPINSKCSKESVREFLRKRREQMDPNQNSEHDSRRRVRSLDESIDDRTRSRSRSRDSKSKNFKKRSQKSNESSVKTSANSRSNSETGAPQREYNSQLSLSSGGSNSLSYENLCLKQGAVISRKDYAHFKTLVGSRNVLKENVIKQKQKSILKPKDSNGVKNNSSNKNLRLDNAPYDPFSAAELQFQDLLGPVKPGGNLRSDMMGSTNSLKHFGLKRFSPERDISSALLKPRSMMGRGSLSLCSLGLDSFDFNSCNTRSPGEDSSEIESLEHSPIEMQSPVNGVDSFLHRFSPSRNTVSYGPTRRSLEEDNQLGGSRYNSRSRSVSSHSNKSFLAGADTNKRDDKVYSWRKSPSPPYHSNNTYDSFNKNSLKEMSPSPQIYRRTSPGFKKSENDIDNHTTTYTTAWSSNSDHMSSPQNYSRYFGDKSYRDQPSGSPNPSLSSSAHDSIRALRATLDEEMKAQQKTIESLDKPQRASSSSSSTDSSLLHQLSPSISPSGKMKTSISTHSSKPIFCYECGNRYPVLVAKFCCNCGAKRLVAAE